MLKGLTGGKTLESLYLLDIKPIQNIFFLLKKYSGFIFIFLKIKIKNLMVIHNNFANRSGLEPAMIHSNFCPINFRW
jgi:hypothetical protein